MKIYIAIPSGDNKIYCKTTQSLINMTKILNDNKILYSINFYYGSLIPRIRNNITSDFLKTNSTHLLFIDSDIYHFEKYIMTMINYNKMIVGCSYPIKQFDNDLLLKNIKNKKHLFNSSTLFNINLLTDNINENINNINELGFLKVKHLPTGFLLISRMTFIALESKVKKYLNENNKYVYNFFDTRIYKNRYLSEDYSFSQLCVDSNINLNCLTIAKIGHIGIFNYFGNLKDILLNYKK